ncbi:MAG: beta-lactamase family protein [Bdellovibrionales bacterium]|nr:beta-lactamase family protein [Bdellovibrionales bacterium]
MSFEQELRKRIEPDFRLATPGLKLQVYSKGVLAADLALGEVSTYYDWASLTKIVFSTTALMRLSLKYPDLLATNLSDVLPGFKQPPDAKYFPLDMEIPLGVQPLVTLERLLSHSAGFTWWKPFYKDIETARANSIPGTSFSGWRFLRKILLSERPDFQGKAVYSDIDFFLLGFALEEMVGRPLESLWKEIAGQIGLEDVHFCKDNKPARDLNLYAPTEIVPERGGVLQGRVHDDNTFAFGGVAPHAGLFGTMSDLSKFGLMLRSCLKGEAKGSWELDQYVVEYFTGRRLPETVGDWGLGFMKPTVGASSCGPLFSPHSFGHTGFTGTSLWFDPERDLLVTILSNRVHPSRENKLWVQMRPQIHTHIVQLLEGA